MNSSWAKNEQILEPTWLRQPVKATLALCLLALAAYAWWPHRVHPNSTVTPTVLPDVFVANSEDAWMTREIGHEILELVAYACTARD
ncbi:MAG TPA: hypothetical protein VFQ78_06555, partial [Candidatus Udaeobacter sp.]|nr:hypothetical protein [Candidatus Udaeobacter sp.]